MAAFGGGVRIQEPPLRAEGEVLLLHPDAAPGMFSLQQFVQLYSCLVCVCLFCFTVKKVEILHTQSHPEGIGCCHCSVAQSCPTHRDPMDCSTPGLPVHHQLPELTQTHVHRVSDAIQPSHPLLSPSPPAFNLSQHQGLFK